MKKALTLLLPVFLGLFCKVAAAFPLKSQSCLQEHLTAAVALNESRRAIYSEWSQGRSESISDRLIQAEKNALQLSRLVEPWEAQLAAEDIHIICNSLASMDNVPVLKQNPEPQDRSFFDLNRLALARVRLHAAWLFGSYSGLSQESLKFLDAIRLSHDYHCMARHLLESISLASYHAEQEQKAVQNPAQWLRLRALMDTYLAAQINLLPFANKLDADAAPLQAEGIPIICQDVPAIDLPGSF